jgi:putative heme iron utilization protein
MPHESRLTTALRSLLIAQRVAALGTMGEDGAPFVSMVPFAVVPALGCLAIHVSGLAAHTRNLQARADISLMVMQSEQSGEPVHALARVTFAAQAKALQPESVAWQACRTAYLARFPEAEPMTQLGDFMFFSLQVSGARQIAGFGAARSIDAQEVSAALRPPA